MRTILFVTELGGGRGHIARLSAVASIARSLNFRTVLAIRSSEAVKKQDNTSEYDEYEQSPVFPRLKNTPAAFKVSGLASSLARVGFVDDRIISALVQQWQELIARYKPAFIVGDFAPYARLASLGRVPFLMVGSGYTLPTSDGLLAFPHSSPRRDPYKLNQLICEATNKGLAAQGAALIKNPSDCLRGDWNAVACVPLLDPTVARNQQEYFGPFEDFPLTQIRNTTKPECYGYMHSITESECNKINNLTNAGYPVDLYCDGPIDGALKGVGKLTAPLSLDQIVSRYCFVLHQGGLGLSTFCLQAALPQLLCPKHTEASMTAQKLSALGCGVVMNSIQDSRDKGGPASDPPKLLENDATEARFSVASETREWIESQDWKAKVEAIFASH